MAILKGNERETIQSNWPTGWRWPGNVPAGYTATENAKGVELIAFDVPICDPQAVLRAPPIIAAAPPTDQALGQLVVRESAPRERVQQAFTRGSVLPDLVYTAFGTRVIRSREIPANEKDPLQALTRGGLRDDLFSTGRAVVGREAPPRERRPLEALLRWSIPQDLLSHTRSVIQGRESPANEPKVFEALLRWGVPANFIAPPLLGNQVVRARETVPQELRAIDPTIKFRVPDNLVYTAYGNAWINGRELSPQETNRIAPLVRWFDPTVALAQTPPPSGRIILPGERWAYDFDIISPYANSVAGPGPVQEPPPFGRVFTRQEFNEPWIISLAGQVTLPQPIFRPLIVGREQRLFENIQAVTRAAFIASLVYPAFGGRVITLREQYTRGDLQALLRSGQPADIAPIQIPPFKPVVVGLEQRRFEDIQALLRWGQPANLAPLLGSQIIRGRELSPQEINRIQALLRSPRIPELVATAFGERLIVLRQLQANQDQPLEPIVLRGVPPPDYIPVIATGRQQKRKWRRGSS